MSLEISKIYAVFEFLRSGKSHLKNISAGETECFFYVSNKKHFHVVYFCQRIKKGREKVLKQNFSKKSAIMAKETSALVCSIKSSSPKKSMQPKVLTWNRAEPRPTAEYVDRKFAEPFNIVAPELRVIGGLGPIKCVGKQKQNPPLINRPTQVQKLCHTTTKLLPNFTLTEQLRPVRCRKKKKAKVAETVKRVKFAENLPTPTLSPVPSETKRTFNHQNPFNLDLNALSAYQKQKHNVEEMERRKNYQIIRRTMETKALKEEGPERFKQETREEKFKHEFFKVVETNEDEKSSEFLDGVVCKLWDGG